jgi:hypothetical protein
MDETLQERLPYASRAVNALSAIALHGYHITLDTTTERRWHAAMRAMRTTDSYADQSDDSGRLVQLLDFLASFEDSYPELAAEQLGAARYSRLIRGAATILKYGEQLRTTDTSEGYMALRAGEASATAEVITQLATDEVIHQPNFIERFVPSVRRLTTGAGFVDTAIDAERDFREGTLAFPPTLAFRARLLRKGAAELAPLAPVLARPRVVAAFGNLVLQAMKSERIKRR